MLAKYRVADVVSGSLVDDDEAIIGSTKRVLETVIAGADTDIMEDDETGRHPPPVDDGERRLAAAVFEHESGSGGGTAPQRADGTTASDVFGRQPDEDVVDDLLRMVLEQGHASTVRHGAP